MQRPGVSLCFTGSTTAGISALVRGVLLLAIAAPTCLGASVRGEVSLRGHQECVCDFCSSAQRLHPTSVANAKCVPAVGISPSASCRTTSEVVTGADIQGLPYALFCLCHCQPLLMSKQGPQQCVQFSSKELQKAAGDHDGNCHDPMLPEQSAESYYKSEDEMLESAEGAKAEAQRPSTEEEKADYHAVAENTEKARQQYIEASVARENARMLRRSWDMA
mmetsp:Transcript_60743/g.131703  ORF Transcript_60743/g.131703 Transcript_60743/m.131703 type:complete len:220 (-) Transcript_60743:42-701(-)